MNGIILPVCQGHGGREITIRHNQVVATIERFAKLAGAVVVDDDDGGA